MLEFLLFFKHKLDSLVSNGFNTRRRKIQGTTECLACCAQLAQSVEQGIENPRVLGSIPRLGTI